jgi:beta-lactamase class A
LSQNRGRNILAVLVVVLAVTNAATLWSSTAPGDDRERARPAQRYPFISPLRALLPQEHLLTSLEPLRRDIKELVAAHQDVRASVYIEFLNTGANINVNQEFRFWPASLAKVPVALATMKAIESGTWTLGHTLELTESDRQNVSSRLHGLPPGTRLTIDTLLKELLSRSDNTAYRLLLRSLPEEELEVLRDAIGLEELFDIDGRITAKEYSRIFRTLYTSSFLEERHSQYLLEQLDRSDFTLFLRAQIPAEVAFPHKWGSFPLDHTFGDAGIVYVPNRPYLITVLTQGDGGPDERVKVQRLMHAVSAMAYTYFAKSTM